MNLPKTILVPTDFSDPAEEALDYAILLAEKNGAKITVMHAYEVPSMGFPVGALLTSADVVGQLRTAALAALEAVIGKRRSRGVELVPQVALGDPRESIHAVAKDIGAELIVMGTHGRRGLSRALLGSTAEYVVRTAECPVLTVRSPAAAGKVESPRAPWTR